jgi:transposase
MARIATEPMATAAKQKELRDTLTQMAEDGRVDEAIDMMVEMMCSMQQKADDLSNRLAKALKVLYGRKSERICENQLSMFIDIMGATDDAVEATGDKAEDEGPKTGDPELDEHFKNKRKEKKRKKPKGRNPLPAHLPREKVALKVEDPLRVCSICGKDKACIGHEKSEVLEWVPGSFKVLVYEREKLACKPCQADVTIAAAADKVIEGGLPGPALLAEVALKKFKYAQPLWRQAHYFRTLGVHVAQSTMCGWVKAGSGLLEPIIKAIREELLLAACINTDDSHIRVLDRDQPRGIKRGAMWVYVGDKTHVLFDYTPSRSSDGPRKILEGYKGKVQADAYSGYDFAYEVRVEDDGVYVRATEVGCAMHARRYFVEALDAGYKEAAVAVKFFWHLYKIEEFAKDIDATADQRREIRQRKSKPVMRKFRRWLRQNRGRYEKKSPFSKAITYARNQWKALNQFLYDGALEIDNGLSERVIRTVAIGRKNFMFAGSDAGAERAAVFYSLICSCDLAKVDAGAYLKDVMKKIASGWPQSRIKELIPANWAKQHAPAHAQLVAAA